MYNKNDLKLTERLAIDNVARFIHSNLLKKWDNTKIPVFIDDFCLSFYFIPCNKNGYPTYRAYHTLSFVNLSAVGLMDGEIPDIAQNETIEEHTVEVIRPLITDEYFSGYRQTPQIYLWEGRIVDKQKIPLEKLNVTNLIKLAQNAIIKRETIILDKASKNKLFK